MSYRYLDTLVDSFNRSMSKRREWRLYFPKEDMPTGDGGILACENPFYTDQRGNRYDLVEGIYSDEQEVYHCGSIYLYVVNRLSYLWQAPAVGVVPVEYEDQNGKSAGDAFWFYRGSFLGEKTVTFGHRGTATDAITLTYHWNYYYQKRSSTSLSGEYLPHYKKSPPYSKIIVGNPTFIDTVGRSYTWTGRSGGYNTYSNTLHYDRNAGKWIIGIWRAPGGWWESSTEPQAFTNNSTKFTWKKLNDDDAEVQADIYLSYSHAYLGVTTAYAGSLPIWQ